MPSLFSQHRQFHKLICINPLIYNQNQDWIYEQSFHPLVLFLFFISTHKYFTTKNLTPILIIASEVSIYYWSHFYTKFSNDFSSVNYTIADPVYYPNRSLTSFTLNIYFYFFYIFFIEIITKLLFTPFLRNIAKICYFIFIKFMRHESH